MGFWEWLSGRKKAPAGGETPPAGPRKWVPVIDRDYCTGCAKCIQTCENHCLGLVWDFATLLKPQDCKSDGACAKACPEHLIEMRWVPTQGTAGTGHWESSDRSAEAG